MARKAGRRQAVEHKGNLAALWVGIACLSAGLWIGHYFGKQAGRSAAVTESNLPSSSVQDTSSFIRNEAALQTLVRTNPGDRNALVQLGNLYYDNERFQQAVDWYGRALELNPEDPNVRTDRGTSFWMLGQPDAAIAEFEKSLEVAPSHPQTLYNLGVVYLHGKGDVEGAKTAWEKLLSANPRYAERTKVEEMLRSLATSPAGPAQSTGSVPGQEESEREKLKDLIRRMKKSP